MGIFEGFYENFEVIDGILEEFYENFEIFEDFRGFSIDFLGFLMDFPKNLGISGGFWGFWRILDGFSEISYEFL